MTANLVIGNPLVTVSTCIVIIRLMFNALQCEYRLTYELQELGS